ncbi:MAG TPA: carboxypeptidase-like regulatory domain-containing protein, partial [Bacteroidales bacterium]|nr:carboxypeptidase-like regulatory domain-containing protein [Bacteroidales bacterium]
MKTFVIYIFLFANFAFFASASDPIPNPDRPPTDANVFGHVTSRGEHIPFISVMIEGTTIGTSTDATGHFMLLNLPP